MDVDMMTMKKDDPGAAVPGVSSSGKDRERDGHDSKDRDINDRDKDWRDSRERDHDRDRRDIGETGTLSHCFLRLVTMFRSLVQGPSERSLGTGQAKWGCRYSCS